MRTKRVAQIGTVVMALTMLTGYVVYSQKGHNPGGQLKVETRGVPPTKGKPPNVDIVAPGSKVS